jgi:hypothetical protein
MLICKCCLPYSSRDTQIFHSQILVIAKIALLLGHVQRNQRRKKKIHGVSRPWTADSLGGIGSSNCT